LERPLPGRYNRSGCVPLLGAAKGTFDDGYEAYRTWILERMIAKGILPKGTQLTPFNPLPKDVANPADYVRPWDSLNADEKKLFTRMAEVYAGFSEYTDVQIGRIIDYLLPDGHPLAQGDQGEGRGASPVPPFRR
jgi:arylsulfatase A-like enzyme